MGNEIEVHRTDESVFVTAEDIALEQEEPMWCIRSYCDNFEPMKTNLLGDELTALALWWLKRPENTAALLQLVAERVSLTAKQTAALKSVPSIPLSPLAAEMDSEIVDE